MPPVKRKTPAKGAASHKKKTAAGDDGPSGGALNEDFFLADDDDKKKARAEEAEEEDEEAQESVEEKRLRLGELLGVSEGEGRAAVLTSVNAASPAQQHGPTWSRCKPMWRRMTGGG